MSSAINIDLGEGTVRPSLPGVSENEFRVALEQFRKRLSDSAIATLAPGKQGIWPDHRREGDF